MMNRMIVAGSLILPLFSCSRTQESKPNVIFILADDLGYGDLRCTGQKFFETPNIDRLASQGMFFSEHYAGTAVSAPSRSSLVTGLHTGHTPIRGNREVLPEGQQPLPGDTYTVFDLFKSCGYATGVFGKWGLGYPGSEGAPENQGVDDFYGYNCQRLAHNYYPYYLWHNSGKVMLKGNEGKNEKEYAPELIHKEAVRFIEKHKDRPFFMMYTTTIPHAELRLPDELNSYKGSIDEKGPFVGVDDGPQYKNGGYGSQQYPHAAFASMIAALDAYVGDIVRVVDSLGLGDNTMIIFASDNGPHREGGADPDFFNSNGIYRGYKRDLYEGGIRTPFIVKWPSRVKAGTVSGHISAFWDFMPTMADVLGVELQGETDGISYLPSLEEKGTQKEHDYLYWEFHELGGRKAVRKGDWKCVVNNVLKGGKPELYNLKNDPSETEDLASQYPEIVSEMETILKNARTESDIFKFESFPYMGKKDNTIVD